MKNDPHSNSADQINAIAREALQAYRRIIDAQIQPYLSTEASAISKKFTNALTANAMLELRKSSEANFEVCKKIGIAPLNAMDAHTPQDKNQLHGDLDVEAELTLLKDERAVYIDDKENRDATRHISLRNDETHEKFFKIFNAYEELSEKFAEIYGSADKAQAAYDEFIQKTTDLPKLTGAQEKEFELASANSVRRDRPARC